MVMATLTGRHCSGSEVTARWRATRCNGVAFSLIPASFFASFAFFSDLSFLGFIVNHPSRWYYISWPDLPPSLEFLHLGSQRGRS